MSKNLSIALIVGLLCFPPQLHAATPPASQQASGQEGLREQQERAGQLRRSVEQPPPKQEAQPAIPSQQPPAAGNQKVLIKKIVVTGNTLLPQAQIDKITRPFEGKEMTVSGMQKVADVVTDAYRQKGFITTRAIIPPQKVQDNTLELQVIVGLMGNLTVQGNHYFKKSLFTQRVTLKKGQPFNYNTLRTDLYNINQYPDRNVKTVIAPGQKPGETDVVFNVKDHLPVHVGFSFDDFGSRYIGKERYTGTVTDNNLLGFDDILTFQYQQAERKAYRLESLRYLFPLTSNTQIGFYGAKNQITLQKEYKDTLARGKSAIYSFFVNQKLVNQPDLKVTALAGFDYKDVYNFLLGLQSSRDRERVFKTGLNVDYEDAWDGRNIFNNEIDFGIPNIMGGMRDVDPNASRTGSGGQFTKDLVDYLRLQRLPWDSTLLFKGEAQFAGDTLTATEQYQLGGISNVRGFAPGEVVGDSGQSATAELSFPLYGLPKNLKVPLSQARVYDALRLAAFYDWGHVAFRDSQQETYKSRILDSYGCGVRLTLPENFFFRLDFAWPVTGRPSDGRGEHTWIQVTKDF